MFTVNGKHILNLKDTYISNNIFTRNTGNITKTVNLKDNSVSTQIKVNLDPIKLHKQIYQLRSLNIPNTNIGTLDIETYINDGICKVYALGFYTKKYNSKTYYINENLDSSVVVLRCIDELVFSKY